MNSNPTSETAAIFWRERMPQDEVERARILATRCPTELPRWVSRAAAEQFAAAGRTRLERAVRRAMIEELYAVRA